jgi:hypothetical protein
MHDIIMVCHVLFLTITRDVYCCCRRGEDGNGGGDPKGRNINTAHNPKKMSTFEKACFVICKE